MSQTICGVSTLRVRVIARDNESDLIRAYYDATCTKDECDNIDVVRVMPAHKGWNSFSAEENEVAVARIKRTVPHYLACRSNDRLRHQYSFDPETGIELEFIQQ